jgi:hypothetical protein
MLSSQEDQHDRREVQRNDLLLRKQQQQEGSTYLAQTHNDTGGRFSAVGAAHVIGSTPVPQYPAASAPFQSDPVGPEPPLSAYENPGFEPSTPSACVEDSGPADAPFSPVDVERAGPSHSGDPTTEDRISPSTSRPVGSPVPYRRF